MPIATLGVCTLILIRVRSRFREVSLTTEFSACVCADSAEIGAVFFVFFFNVHSTYRQPSRLVSILLNSGLNNTSHSSSPATGEIARRFPVCFPASELGNPSEDKTTSSSQRNIATYPSHFCTTPHNQRRRRSRADTCFGRLRKIYIAPLERY